MRTRRPDRDGEPVVALADIHDIRLLTATGPIALPLKPVLEPEPRSA